MGYGARKRLEGNLNIIGDQIHQYVKSGRGISFSDK